MEGRLTKNPMPIKPKRAKNTDDYFELVRRVPLRPIRSDGELAAAIAMIDTLIDQPRLTRGAQDYLDVLSDLVHKYETEGHPMTPVSDAALLRHLLEAKGATQIEVVRATGIAESTISAFLAGKRHPSRQHVAKLAAYFAVSPTAFAWE
jgi:HTH-type transcriptional regulator/antitoxin HigA